MPKCSPRARWPVVPPGKTRRMSSRTHSTPCLWWGKVSPGQSPSNAEMQDLSKSVFAVSQLHHTHIIQEQSSVKGVGRRERGQSRLRLHHGQTSRYPGHVQSPEPLETLLNEKQEVKLQSLRSKYTGWGWLQIRQCTRKISESEQL